MRRFQDEVRSALMKYALVPGFLITLICILLAGIYWDRNVAARTEEQARTAGDIFTELTRDYDRQERHRRTARGRRRTPYVL